MPRRDFLKFSLRTATLAALSSRVCAQGAVREIRVGYQKNGVLVIARQQAALEKHFASQGVEVKWVEFSSGPPIVTEDIIATQQGVADRFHKLGLILKPIAIRDIVWRSTAT